MSHTTTMNAKLTNEGAVRRACEAMGLEAPAHGQHRFYDGKTAEGLLVKLPGWKHPVVVKADGELVFDHYNGAWGKQLELDRFLPQYSAAVVEEQLGGQWAIAPHQEADGTIHLHLSR